VDEPHVHAGVAYPVARALEGLVDDVDAGDLPAALREWDFQIPLPQPSSSAGPYGGSRLLSSRSKIAEIFSVKGGLVSASSQG
jgi:hypothetical protein